MTVSHISHEGRKYPVEIGSLPGSEPGGRRKTTIQFLTPNAKGRQRELIREGTFVQRDGTPLTGRAAQRLRDRLLGTYAHLPERETFGSRREAGPRRMLIGDLWPWGHIPVLGGNPKAGKTTLVADLVRALTVPGYRFLGRFEPAELSESERVRGVVLINAETPAEDMEAAIGLDEEPDLTVYHLEDLGGAASFDVTAPDAYDQWAHELADCYQCDGTDDRTPFVVVVDGVTAILGNDTRRYGEWYAAFRALMRECDVPNALAVAHHTLSGDHLMGGVEAQAGADGLWTYSSADCDDPGASRWFSVRPRLGGVAIPATRVALSEEGRPVMDAGEQSEAERELMAGGLPEPATADEKADHDAGLIAVYVTAHPGADGEEITRNAGVSPREESQSARKRAVDMELITEEKCAPACAVCSEKGRKWHHRRTHFWPPEGDPIGNEED